MDIQVEQRGAVSLVRLRGRLTIGGGESALVDGVRELIRGNRKQVVFAMSDVPYVDSSGLAALVSSYRLLEESGGKVRLLAPSPRVLDLLRLTHLDTVLETFSEEHEALAAF